MNRNSVNVHQFDGDSPRWSPSLRDFVRSLSSSSSIGCVIENSCNFRSNSSNELGSPEVNKTERNDAVTSHEVYYALSPVFAHEVSLSGSSGHSGLSSDQSGDLPEYFSLTKHDDVVQHDDVRDDIVNNKEETGSAFSIVDQSCLDKTMRPSTPSGSEIDFLSDGYCHCSFCNHDDIFSSNTAEWELASPLIGIKRKRSSSIDLTDCSPPWFKERRLSQLSEEYKESAFYKALTALIQQCQSEIMKEEQVNRVDLIAFDVIYFQAERNF